MSAPPAGGNNPKKTRWQQFWLALGLSGTYFGSLALAHKYPEQFTSDRGSVQTLADQQAAAKALRDSLTVLQRATLSDSQRAKIAADSLLQLKAAQERIADSTARAAFAKDTLPTLEKFNELLDSLGIKGDTAKLGKKLKEKLASDCSS